MGFTPKSAKEKLALAHFISFVIAIIIAITYFILPIDIIPDVIPVIGWADDTSVGIGALILSSLLAEKIS